MRPLPWLALLGIACLGAAAHATGMSFAVSSFATGGDPLVVASAAPAEPRDLLQDVGFRTTRDTLGGWSEVAGRDPVLSGAHAFGAGAEAERDAAELPACSDSFDNDGDGRTDFPDDPGCLTPGSVTEQPRCQDGIDTDGDGAIDFDGGASVNGGVPLGAPDPECEGAPWRYVERP